MSFFFGPEKKKLILIDPDPDSPGYKQEYGKMIDEQLELVAKKIEASNQPQCEPELHANTIYEHRVKDSRHPNKIRYIQPFILNHTVGRSKRSENKPGHLYYVQAIQSPLSTSVLNSASASVAQPSGLLKGFGLRGKVYSAKKIAGSLGDPKTSPTKHVIKRQASWYEKEIKVTAERADRNFNEAVREAQLNRDFIPGAKPIIPHMAKEGSIPDTKILMRDMGDSFADKLKDIKNVEEYLTYIIETYYTWRETVYENGWVHLDLKPDNIVVSSDGQITLIDPAFVKNIGDRVCAYQGTLAYSHPMMLYLYGGLSDPFTASPAFDLYSLGIFVADLLGAETRWDQIERIMKQIRESKLIQKKYEELDQALQRSENSAKVNNFTCKKFKQMQEQAKEQLKKLRDDFGKNKEKIREYLEEFYQSNKTENIFKNLPNSVVFPDTLQASLIELIKIFLEAIPDNVSETLQKVDKKMAALKDYLLRERYKELHTQAELADAAGLMLRRKLAKIRRESFTQTGSIDEKINKGAQNLLNAAFKAIEQLDDNLPMSCIQIFVDSAKLPTRKFNCTVCQQTAGACRVCAKKQSYTFRSVNTKNEIKDQAFKLKTEYCENFTLAVKISNHLAVILTCLEEKIKKCQDPEQAKKLRAEYQLIDKFFKEVMEFQRDYHRKKLSFHAMSNLNYKFNRIRNIYYGKDFQKLNSFQETLQPTFVEPDYDKMTQVYFTQLAKLTEIREKLSNLTILSALREKSDLFANLGGRAEKLHAEACGIAHYRFNSSHISYSVAVIHQGAKEIKVMEKNWKTFCNSTHFPLDIFATMERMRFKIEAEIEQPIVDAGSIPLDPQQVLVKKQQQLRLLDAMQKYILMTSNSKTVKEADRAASERRKQDMRKIIDIINTPQNLEADIKDYLTKRIHNRFTSYISNSFVSGCVSSFFTNNKHFNTSLLRSLLEKALPEPVSLQLVDKHKHELAANPSSRA